MHAVLQRPSENSFPDFEATNYPRKTWPRIQGTLHLNAVLGLIDATYENKLKHFQS